MEQIPNRKRRSKRIQARDERRSQLIDAARKVFGLRGYHSTTVDDITRAVGIAKGTFYLYFPEKREIFYELIGQFFKLVTEIGRSIADEVNSKEEYFARIEAAAKRLTKIFKDNRDLVRLTYRESMGMDEKLEKMVRNFYRQMAQVEAKNIQLGVKLGIFRDDVNPQLAAYAHIGMVERVLLQWVFDHSFPHVEDLVHQIIELAYRGLKR